MCGGVHYISLSVLTVYSVCVCASLYWLCYSDSCHSFEIHYDALQHFQHISPITNIMVMLASRIMYVLYYKCMCVYDIHNIVFRL